MAGQDTGRREVVNDPLAINGREQRPDRSMGLQGVRPPNNGDSNAFAGESNKLLTAMDNISTAISNRVVKARDEAIVQGKTDYLTGVTEQEMQKRGDRYGMQGYQTLKARDTVNNWFTTEAIGIDEAARTMPPEQYNEYIAKRRKEVLDGIADPDAKRVAVAAFEELSPKLAQTQLVKNNEYNRQETLKSFTSGLGSTATVSPDKTVQEGPLRLSPRPIYPAIPNADKDRDTGIRTMLGEAAGEGSEGMAAVAHVLRNRTQDSRFPSTIGQVALQDKQFSTWNDGPGGNGAARGFGPGNELYERAGVIYDAVMAGRHIDSTGGATHYYSPKGMTALGGPDKPDWWDSEVGKAGGSVKIGGHLFAGKSGTGFSGQGKLSFAHAGQENIDPSFKSILTDVSGAMGKPLRITSGLRDANHPVEASKKNGGGEHTHGTASDIDMTGMDDKERSQLVQQLRSRGVLRFGTYDNEPNMLHVDMKDQTGKGTTWFMHNKSNGNMAKAPAWFKEAQSAEVAPAVATGAPASGNQIQNFIRGFSGLKPEEKATGVADAMRRGLDNGDDSMFNDAGGIAVLNELQAKPSEVDEVLKAKERFDAKKAGEFNVGRELKRNDYLARAEKGEPLPSILADIEKDVKSGTLDDSNARSLASAAADKIRQVNGKDNKKTQLGNIDFLNELGGLYQQIQVGAKFEDVAPKVKGIAEKYGATEGDVQQVVGQMFTMDQSYKNGLRADAEAAAKKGAEARADKAEVERSLSRGTGLSSLSGGEIEIVDETGNKKKVSKQDYGVMLVKEKHAEALSKQVSDRKIDPATAAQKVVQLTYLELQEHNVVDTRGAAEIRGGLIGNILDKTAESGLKEGATQAYNAYLTLRNTPGITPGYLSKMTEDPYVRTLAETAYMLDSGDMSPEQALLKAHEIVNDPNRDPTDRIAKDAVWQAKRDKSIDDMLVARTRPGFWGSMDDWQKAGEATKLKQHKGVAKSWVTNRAELYHLQNPNEDAQVSLEKSIQDLDRNATTVAGNLLIAKTDRELSKVMGVPDAKAAEAAITQYMYKNGETLWGKNYTDKKESYASAGFRSGGRPVAPEQPGLHITYNAESEMISVDLYADEDKGKTLGAPKHFRVKDLGKSYMKEQNEVGTWSKGWDSMFDTFGSGIKSLQAMPDNAGAAEAGKSIGSMLKPTN